MNSIKILKNLEISPCLAEISGIHAGDGYLRYDDQKREFDLSDSYEEKEYYNSHVIPLFNRFFNLSIRGKYFLSRRTYGFRTSNQKVIEALVSLGFPSGKKTTIVSVPRQILDCKDTAILCAFLRGYFDTDGSLTFDKKVSNASFFQRKYNYYPRLMFTTCSKNLAYGFKELVQKLRFICRIYTYRPKKKTESLKYKLQITGKRAVDYWMTIIGTKNPSKISRYLIWKKFGFCPPNTTYQQRINILNGKLNPESLY